MEHVSAYTDTSVRHERLLTTLEGLLTIPATDVTSALNQASDLVATTLGADKVDVFLYDGTIDTLVALGTSNTAMGRQQKALGLDRLPVSNGGKTAVVYSGPLVKHTRSASFQWIALLSCAVKA